MIIDFINMDETVIHEFRGGKKDTVAKMHVDELGKIMSGKHEPDASIGIHTHETSSEIIFIMNGKSEVIQKLHFLRMATVKRRLNLSMHHKVRSLKEKVCSSAL